MTKIRRKNDVVTISIVCFHFRVKLEIVYPSLNVHVWKEFNIIAMRNRRSHIST